MHHRDLSVATGAMQPVLYPPTALLASGDLASELSRALELTLQVGL